VIIAALLTLLLVVYVLAGESSGSKGPPSDRLTDRQAGADTGVGTGAGAEAQPPADPWATLPGNEGGMAMAPDYVGEDGEIAPPPPPAPPPPAPIARAGPINAPPRAAPAPSAGRRTAPSPNAPRPAGETPTLARGAVARPSFNCRNARTRGEIAVCRDSGLAGLDREMASQFNRAMSRASAAQRLQLQRTRGSFLRRRDACASEACIAGTYRARINEIGTIVGNSARATPAATAKQTATRTVSAAPASTARPSFNCRNARTKSEIAVCNDAGLAGLDRQMSSHFNNAMRQATPAQRELLERTRGRFLAYRNQCGSPDCIAEAYRDRMREINDIAAGRWRVP
jgi:uncharacterized protein